MSQRPLPKVPVKRRERKPLALAAKVVFKGTAKTYAPGEYQPTTAKKAKVEE